MVFLGRVIHLCIGLALAFAHLPSQAAEAEIKEDLRLVPELLALQERAPALRTPIYISIVVEHTANLFSTIPHPYHTKHSAVKDWRVWDSMVLAVEQIAQYAFHHLRQPDLCTSNVQAGKPSLDCVFDARSLAHKLQQGRPSAGTMRAAQWFNVKMAELYLTYEEQRKGARDLPPECPYLVKSLQQAGYASDITSGLELLDSCFKRGGIKAKHVIFVFASALPPFEGEREKIANYLSTVDAERQQVIYVDWQLDKELSKFWAEQAQRDEVIALEVVPAQYFFLRGPAHILAGLPLDTPQREKPLQEKRRRQAGNDHRQQHNF